MRFRSLFIKTNPVGVVQAESNGTIHFSRNSSDERKEYLTCCRAFVFESVALREGAR